ncbi:hypothetical protein - conserved [Leishmania donovani]|uniref:Hypothetical_protein_conserved n=1 Tax=Leishmania donovani TaxID=5661 RepID=A0A504X722_LEIDO|nr:hypothetical protein CGC20_11620 [Leishmania donovani]CAJ1989105.1 hypothetical protein - conserved [Leishmania donovani]VDZ44977.1 hypothetical_protein_conserved [Leishmania donovani]
MKPYVWPTSDEAPPPSGRRTFPCQFKVNHGTLNLFSPAAPEPQQCSTRAVAGPFSITGQRGILHQRNHNRESTATREFPVNGLRRVSAPQRSETPHGIRHIRGAAGAQQHVQVVNITDAYKDPMQMGPRRTGVKCLPQKSESNDVSAALAFAGSRQQLSARVLAAPVGKPSRPSLCTIDYSDQERFAQAVRDHAQKRARGVAEFYVQLVRDTVGGVTSSTPKPAIVPWSLDQEPTRRVLTLERCRDQLVALTSMPISLSDLAQLLWVSSDGEAANSDGLTSDFDKDASLPLSCRPVPFRDFAAAFGQNSSDVRLARMKV